MIIVDASAVLAILLEEPDRNEIVETLTTVGDLAMSPVNYWEVLVRAHALDGAAGVARAEEVVRSFGIQIASVDAATAQLALDAFVRFGRRTPAGLNLGDCFAYALAKQRSAPLLFKGEDFAKTDIAAA